MSMRQIQGRQQAAPAKVQAALKAPAQEVSKGCGSSKVSVQRAFAKTKRIAS
jgi:hypothetical protein